MLLTGRQLVVNAFKKPSEFQFPWFGASLVGIWLFSLGLRFWGLDRFNTLVFDEVYYAKFAHNYLSQTPFFDGHPPLSKYIIAIGMWLGDQMPFGQTEKNGLTGGLYAPWTYRWVNALTGSLIPLVIAGVAYQLLRRRSFALIAALFAAWDGLLLVESRYALNNVYLIIFGLLGWWFLLLALNDERAGSFSATMRLRRSLWLVLAGVGFGLSVAIKWNGLWFLLGAYGVWLLVQGLGWQSERQRRPLREMASGRSPTSAIAQQASPLPHFRSVRWWQMGLYLGLLPFLTYALTWLPHLQLNAKQGYWKDFWALQFEILSYHNRVGTGPEVHPYCSTWYSWLVMWRPVAYFYRVTGRGEPLPTEQTLPPTTPDQVIYDVHAIGNPILWWLSTLAIALVLFLTLSLMVQHLRWGQSSRQRHRVAMRVTSWRLSLAEQWLLLFLTVNYLANLLPWVRVTRCIFIYHYMGALVFASLALAWLVDRWLHSERSLLQYVGIAMCCCIGLAFLYWMPLYLGLPVTAEDFRRLMWLPSWV